MIHIYRFFMLLFTPLFLIFGTVFSNKIREGLRLRRTRLNYKNMPKLSSCYWIHAASGEYEYARPLIARLKVLDPAVPVVVTVFSPSYLKAVENDPLVDYVFPLPLDLPGSVRSFISRMKPKAVFFSRTDLWPELLTQLRYKKIPTVLFAFFQNPKQNSVQRFFKSQMLRKLTWIDAVEDSTWDWLSSLGFKNISKSGDTRFDQVIDRLSRLKTLPFDWDPHSKTLVLGSTWGEDEKVLVPALAKTHDLWDKVFLAPHEPSESHLKHLESRLRAAGLSVVRFSDIPGTGASSTGAVGGARSASISTVATEKSIILVDKVGWLMSLYQYATVAFVGGSFKGSTHSVMEPLAHGVSVLVGPYISNNAEALEFQGNLVHVCHDENELVSQIKHLMGLPQTQREELRAVIQTAIRQKAGASDRLVDELKQQKILV